HVSGPLAPRLRRAHPPVSRTRTLPSPPRPSLLASIGAHGSSLLHAHQPAPFLRLSAAVTTVAPARVALLASATRARSDRPPSPVSGAATAAPRRCRWAPQHGATAGADAGEATRSGARPG